MNVIGFGILGVVFSFIVLDCSGLNFPVIGKQASLVGGVKEDLGVVMPSSLRVMHAARVATRDPAYLYECEIAAGDVGKLIDDLNAAAASKAYSTDWERDKRYASGATTPAWYTPGSCADIQQLKIALPDSPHHPATGYWFFFSRAAGKVWVFWYST
jgi:hypothetical protein